jgi:hypothetical protein
MNLNECLHDCNSHGEPYQYHKHLWVEVVEALTIVSLHLFSILDSMLALHFEHYTNQSRCWSELRVEPMGMQLQTCSLVRLHRASVLTESSIQIFWNMSVNENIDNHLLNGKFIVFIKSINEGGHFGLNFRLFMISDWKSQMWVPE